MTIREQITGRLVDDLAPHWPLAAYSALYGQHTAVGVDTDHAGLNGTAERIAGLLVDMRGVRDEDTVRQIITVALRTDTAWQGSEAYTTGVAGDLDATAYVRTLQDGTRRAEAPLDAMGPWTLSDLIGDSDPDSIPRPTMTPYLTTPAVAAENPLNREAYERRLRDTLKVDLAGLWQRFTGYRKPVPDTAGLNIADALRGLQRPRPLMPFDRLLSETILGSAPLLVSRQDLDGMSSLYDYSRGTVADPDQAEIDRVKRKFGGKPDRDRHEIREGDLLTLRHDGQRITVIVTDGSVSFPMHRVGDKPRKIEVVDLDRA